jgi:hypothetical protein
VLGFNVVVCVNLVADHLLEWQVTTRRGNPGCNITPCRCSVADFDIYSDSPSSPFASEFIREVPTFQTVEFKH